MPMRSFTRCLHIVFQWHQILRAVKKDNADLSMSSAWRKVMMIFAVNTKFNLMSDIQYLACGLITELGWHMHVVQRQKECGENAAMMGKMWWWSSLLDCVAARRSDVICDRGLLSEKTCLHVQPLFLCHHLLLGPRRGVRCCLCVVNWRRGGWRAVLWSHHWGIQCVCAPGSNSLHTHTHTYWHTTHTHWHTQ